VPLEWRRVRRSREGRSSERWARRAGWRALTCISVLRSTRRLLIPLCFCRRRYPPHRLMPPRT